VVILSSIILRKESLLKQYISNVITEQEIGDWKNGDKILIHAQTGSGKSYFIKNTLYDYCKSRDKTILLLSNRIILKAQNEVDLEGKLSIIHPENYQKLESEMLSGAYIDELFSGYDIIVYDEAHYLFSDSQFNRNTDLLIEPIKKSYPDKIFIFCTATPDALVNYYADFDRLYTIPFDYHYVNNIYFYNKSETVDQIISNIPQDEKIIFFSSNAFDAFQVMNTHNDSTFICSKDNKSFGKKSNPKTIHEIVNYNTFYSKILCTTKVLDNGVNIIDKSVKHIIIDMLDPISLVQCIGRKRIVDEDDQITLYVKNYHGGNLYAQVEELNKRLNFVKELESLGAEGFQAKYKKKEFDSIIQNDFTINKSKLVHYKTMRQFYLTMLGDRDKIGYKKVVCDMLYQHDREFFSAENKFEKSNLDEILQNLVGVQLFGEEIEKFKNIFFSNIFSSKRVDYRKRGILCVNAILKEDSLPYKVTSGRGRKKSNRDKWFWVVEKDD